MKGENGEEEKIMKFRGFYRYLLAVSIFLMLAFLTVYEEVKSYNISYQLNREESRLKKASEENKTLTLSVSRVELPQNVLANAKAFGLNVKNFDNNMLAKMRVNKPESATQLAQGGGSSKSNKIGKTSRATVSHRPNNAVSRDTR